MPLANYGVLVGRPLRGVPGRGTNAHYQVHVVDTTTEYRIAVNVKSQMSPSEVEYLVDEDFQHPITELLQHKAHGFYPLGNLPNSGSLDFIRGNLFDRTHMRPLPMNLPGPDDDLNDKLDHIIQAAVAEEDAFVCAFGQRWGPEPQTRDKIFGFLPDNGIHDIHMNQGNSGSFVRDDGIWQDGGLLIFFPSTGKWSAIFLKFQSQTWHTDDQTGHAIGSAPPPPPPGPGPVPPQPGEPDFKVRLVAALINPNGPDQGLETVSLLNTSDADINLGGWQIANRNKDKMPLTGVVKSGQFVTFQLPIQVPLANDGGIITLLDGAGLKVHGVSYTKSQASRQGWTVTF